PIVSPPPSSTLFPYTTLFRSQRLEQDGDALLAFAVDADTDEVALVDLELQPGAPRRDDLAPVEVLVGGLVELAVEVHAGRADKLGDDDTLGAVDDERALGGHEREVAHEHRLALDLTRVVVDELRRDEHRGGVGHVLVLALLFGVLGRLEPMVAERQRHRAREVLDRTDLLEDLFQAGLLRNVLTAGFAGRFDSCTPLLVAEQPVEGLGLQGEEVRDLKWFLDASEGNAVRTKGVSGGDARGCQQGSFRRLVAVDARARR